MLKVKRCVAPSPQQWAIVVHGMRNAYKSWEKSDSHLISIFPKLADPCKEYYLDNQFVGEERNLPDDFVQVYNDENSEDVSWVESEEFFRLGKEDQKLLCNLTKLGTSDRKALRQLPLVFEIEAPLFWWKQADKYQIGTVTNSESTMHTLVKKPFEIEDFSLGTSLHYIYKNRDEVWAYLDETIKTLNTLRDEYLDLQGYKDEFKKGDRSRLEEFIDAYLKELTPLVDYDPNDNEHMVALIQDMIDVDWRIIVELLPESYNQTRTWSLNYETALQIIHQRLNHPLEEWEILIDYLISRVPFLSDLYRASCYKDDLISDLKAKVRRLSKNKE